MYSSSYTCILPERRLVHVQVNTAVCVLSSCVEIYDFFSANNNVCINEMWNGELTKEKKEVADQSAARRQIPNTIKYNFMKNESDWLHRTLRIHNHPSTDVDPHYMDKVAAYRLPLADFVFTEGKRKNITNHLIWVVLIGEQHEKKMENIVRRTQTNTNHE